MSDYSDSDESRDDESDEMSDSDHKREYDELEADQVKVTFCSCPSC